MNSIKNYLKKINCGDATNVLNGLPDNSVDLVVTSPFYKLKNSTGNGMKYGMSGKWKNASLINGYSNYDDDMPHDKYVVWQIN